MDENFGMKESTLVFLSAPMKEIKMTIERIANFDTAVLITGEKGSGKSSLAQYICAHSHRSNNPYLSLHCQSVPRDRMEDLLFGKKDGSGEEGLVQRADGGTLYIDEIGLLPLDLQGQLIDIIMNHRYIKPGTNTTIPIDIRIISSSSFPLENEIVSGTFREDLYYSLRVLEFTLPPLRHRKDDFDEILDQMVLRFNRRYNMNRSFTLKARAAMKNYSWPGNISELQNFVERYVVISKKDEITRSDLPTFVTAQPSQSLDELPTNFDEAIENYKRRIMEEAYAKYSSSYRIANALGITQTRASRMMREYGIGKSKQKTQK